MSADSSIQELFTQLRVEHFLAYLPNNGWRNAPRRASGLLRFELPDDSDSPYVLDLPDSDQTRQSHKLLQRAIHNLSGIEDRQPREIVIDLLTCSAQPPATAQADGTVRLRIRNQHDGSLDLRVASRPSDVTLMEGEAMEIVCQISPEGIVEIVHSAGALQIDDGA